FRMWQQDARGIAGSGIGIEPEGLSRLQRDLAALDLADAQLRPLEIAENADRAAGLLLDGADAPDELLHVRVRGVAHIDAERVGAGQEQFPDPALRRRRRSQRRENLDLAAASHGVPPGRVAEFSGTTSSASCTIQLGWSPVSCS